MPKHTHSNAYGGGGSPKSSILSTFSPLLKFKLLRYEGTKALRAFTEPSRATSERSERESDNYVKMNIFTNWKRWRLLRGEVAAFTLAEVLITIGIVGVVAAMTIPTLMTNIQNEQNRTRFKKAISTLSQASRSGYEQFDLDYSGIANNSSASTCGTDNLADNSTMCGLFNNTLKGKTYLGTYGTVQGRNGAYAITKTTEGFDPANYLLYSLSDGTIIGFSPNAKNCHIEIGNTLTSESLSSGGNLNSCIGFIDVNGTSLPNKEVTCEDGTSALDPMNPCTVKFRGSAMGDVFPIVFHNGTAEPATNASRAIFNAVGGSALTDANASAATRTVTIDGVEYKFLNGAWYHEDGSGNLVSSSGTTYTKTEDGKYTYTLSHHGQEDTYVYDKDMNLLEARELSGGTWYDMKGDLYVREDSNGNLVDTAGNTYTKIGDRYEKTSGSYRYVYDNDMNLLGRYQDNTWFDYYKGVNNYFRKDSNGNLVSSSGTTYTKTEDGYKSGSLYSGNSYDENLNPLGSYWDYTWYDYYSERNDYYRKDPNGNLIRRFDNDITYTKTEDGLYQKGSAIYDENLNRIK